MLKYTAEICSHASNSMRKLPIILKNLKKALTAAHFSVKNHMFLNTKGAF